MKNQKRITGIIAILLAFTILMTGSISVFADTGRWIKSGDRWWYRHSDSSYTTNGWEKSIINGIILTAKAGCRQAG